MNGTNSFLLRNRHLHTQEIKRKVTSSLWKLTIVSLQWPLRLFVLHFLFYLPPSRNLPKFLYPWTYSLDSHTTSPIENKITIKSSFLCLVPFPWHYKIYTYNDREKGPVYWIILKLITHPKISNQNKIPTIYNKINYTDVNNPLDSL